MSSRIDRQPERVTDEHLLNRARGVLAGRRIWRFTDRSGEIEPPDVEPGDFGTVPAGAVGALVLDGAPEPFLTVVGKSGWTCECASERPCIHMAALVLEADRRNPEIMNRLGLSVIETGGGPAGPVPAAGIAQSGSADSPTSGTGPATADTDLWPAASGGSGPDPIQDALFFSEPVPVGRRAVIVFGPEEEVSSTLARRTLPVTGRRSRLTGLFTDMSGVQWVLSPAEIPVREDGDAGPPRFSTDSNGFPPEISHVRESVREIVDLCNSPSPPLNVDGRPWTVQAAEGMRLRFDPLLSPHDGEAYYRPVFEMTLGGRPRTGGILISKELLLLLDNSRSTILVLEGSAGLLRFVRLMLSRRVLGASDIRARIRNRLGVPPGIEVVVPDLPELLPTLAPRAILEVSSRGDRTDFHIRWGYHSALITPAYRGDIVIDPADTGNRRNILGLRDQGEEQRLIDRIETIFDADLAWRRGRYSGLAGDPETPLRLNLALHDALSRYGEALLREGVEVRLENRIVRWGGRLSIRAQREGGVLEFQSSVATETEMEDLELDEWMERSGLVRTTRSYFLLTGRALEQLSFLRNHGMNPSGFLSTSPDNLSLIDAVYAQLEGSDETIADLEDRKSVFRDLAGFDPLNYPEPPPDFRAVLRPYQRYGYAWLLHHGRAGLGACLADDMGLGKTIQTLACLSRLKADGKLGPSLMVGPVVTLANWEAELRRFAPALAYSRYSGPSDRRVLPGPEAGVDLVLVSYQTLRNDAEKFFEREWDHVILDEAHYVKNSASRTFRVVRSLTSRHRISLTGTPLENHLNELWSQMTFLNPGLLGNQRQFHERYVRSAEHGREESIQRLSDTVAPFILRRRKTDVLKELPARDESVIRCDMTDDQAEAYDRMKNVYRRRVTGLLTDSGIGGARVEILSILTKLRLLAIHPPLAGDLFAGIGSGKMDVLDNLLDEILEEQHKTLVFSQFLGALDRAEATCRNRSWRYSRLTGSTRDREQQIGRFNEDPATRVFLLSLKAGGVGINLTAADYVILLDPWWNPAVEAQAIDRAHRMGQTRPVMAYRLITAGTIEENVLALQERKKAMVEGVLGDGTAPLLNEEQILDLLR